MVFCGHLPGLPRRTPRQYRGSPVIDGHSFERRINQSHPEDWKLWELFFFKPDQIQIVEFLSLTSPVPSWGFSSRIQNRYPEGNDMTFIRIRKPFNSCRLWIAKSISLFQSVAPSLDTVNKGLKNVAESRIEKCAPLLLAH